MKGQESNSIFARSLLLNIAIGVVVSLCVVLIFLQTLKFFTNHGDYLRVPDVTGKTLPEATKLLETQGFEIVIQDSVFEDTLRPLEIVKQFPEVDATVKVNRTVYLTVNRSVPPLIDMPNLVGMTFRNAELELRSRGLKLGDTTYVPDIAKNAVKEQLLNGVPLKPGTKIVMGSVVSLVLGAGVGNELIPVPDLFGMTYAEAKILLEANGINLGVVLPDLDVTDTASGFIYWQNPPRFTEDKRLNSIRSGQMMDIRLSLQVPVRDTTTVINNEF